MTQLEEILQHLRIEYKKHGEHHHVMEGWIGIDCPYCGCSHGNKGRYKLGINLNSLATTCWTCGRHNVVEVLSYISNKNKSYIVNLLKNVRKIQNSVEPAKKLVIPSGLTELQEPHIKYLTRRGFDADKIAKLWNIKALSITGNHLAWRIYIPIYLDNRQVSWTTRSISDNVKNKYMTAKREEELISHKSILYGLDYIGNTIIVVEGPLDVWKIGFGAAATFGTTVTHDQIRLIAKYPRRVICFDSDAIDKARKLARILEIYDGKTWVVALDAEDPAGASDREIQLLRKSFL